MVRWNPSTCSASTNFRNASMRVWQAMPVRDGNQESHAGDVGPRTEVVPASLGARFVAAFLDGLIVSAPLWIVAPFLFDAVQGYRFGHGVIRALVVVVIDLAVVAYPVGFVAAKGQTPGKMAIGIRVMDVSSGGRPSVGQAVRRYVPVLLASMAVGVVLPGAGGLVAVALGVSVLADRMHRGLHDKVAGTIVVAG